MPAIKTAISIDKQLFQKVNRLSKRMRIPRSRLFSRAVEEFVRRHDSEDLVRRINKAYANGETADEKAVRRGMLRNFSKLVEGTW